MMSLDDLTRIKQLDPVNVLGSIEQLGEQCQQAWQEASRLQFPKYYRQITSIVFSGMGGSALGGYVMKSLYGNSISIPFEIVNDYHLPRYVNSKTLVILASYSGTTEETISCAKEAVDKQACVLGLTTGGTLAEILTQAGVPAYIFKPHHNPSNQPRLGTGYSVFGQIAMLNALNILTVPQREVDEAVHILATGTKLYTITIPQSNNPPKQMAVKWQGKIPIIISGEFLTHVGRVIRNQLHESAKSFAAYHEIPELNHHLMEGLKNPVVNKEMLAFFFLNSPLYSENIRKRLSITKEVVLKQGIMVDEFIPRSASRLAQALECIQFGAFANYYLALLYGVDPSQIPWVDYFKRRLKELNK